MLPENFYFSGAAWLGYIIYVPLALLLTVLIYFILLRRLKNRFLYFGLPLVICMTLITAQLWEATAVSYEAQKLCSTHSGLRVYKTANVRGFLTVGAEYWLKNGFEYIETAGPNNKKMRVTLNDGKAKYEEVAEFISQYQLTGGDQERFNDNFRRVKYYVEDRHTGEVLGELEKFKIYPSAFDSYMLHFLGGSAVWICGDEAPAGRGEFSPTHGKRIYGSSDVVRATLIPKTGNVDE